MLDQLFKFYKKELTFYGNVVRKNTKLQKLLFWVLFACGVLSTVYFLYGVYHNELCLWVLLITAPFFISCIILISYANKKTIKKLYPTYLDNPEKWDDLYTSKLKQHLDKLDLKENQLDHLQILITDKITNIKRSYLAFTVVFVIIWSPIWAKIADAFWEKKLPFLLILAVAFTVFFWIIKGLIDQSPKIVKLNKLNDLIKGYRLNKQGFSEPL